MVENNIHSINNHLNEAFNCDFADHSSKQSFRVLSQTVQVFSFNFVKKSFCVSTEIQVVPLCTNSNFIVLDLGNDCILPNEFGFDGFGKISINDVEASYTRNKFCIETSNNLNDYNLSYLKTAYSQAYSNFLGDLIIFIPEQCFYSLSNQSVLKINIDLIVMSPKQGVIFATNDKDGDTGAHVYTYRSGLLSSTKQWLPCLESSNQLAVWRLEFTVLNEMTVVSCGDLIDTIPCVEVKNQRTFYYQLLMPTSAINIGFAVGQFQIYTQPDIPAIISFSLPGLMPLLKHTVSTLNRIFTFFEEILSCRFPYGLYRQVFVDQLPDEIVSFAGLSIFSLNLLYHKKILDLVFTSRQYLAQAIAQQFFGCFVNSADFNEIWLTKSLSKYITGLFVERIFGLSEYIFQIDQSLKMLCDYESKYGGVVISRKKMTTVINNFPKTINSNNQLDSTYFDSNNPNFCSLKYTNILYKKGHFIMIMLQKRLGKEQFLKVLGRILSVAMTYSQNLTKPIEWFHMIISMDSFFQTIINVTGRELPTFIDQWIYSGGHVQFEVNHTFNRKQNKLELELKQSSSSACGHKSYVGPLTIVIQELDGCFTHTVQVDAAVSKHDILCHSKGRKQKKKRIPLSNGEEIDIELSQMDVDSPVMWIRIDPDNLILRRIHLSQQIHQWEYMLRHERDVIAQFQAIEMLRQFPVHQTQTVLIEAVENDKFFYKVRKAAAKCLVDVCNKLPEGLLEVKHPLIAYFQRFYGCKSASSIPIPNNFVATSLNLQYYFLLLELPLAIGNIRDQCGLICPNEVSEFLLRLSKLNDNSINRYSDDYYRASLIKALSNTLILNEHETEYPEQINENICNIIDEILHALNMDTMKPSFGKIVTIQCLYAIQNLQLLKHIPVDLDIFWKFGLNKNVFSQVRRAAFSCIVLLIHFNRIPLFENSIIRLIDDVILNDSDLYIRYKIAELLCQCPPFVEIKDTLHTNSFSTNSSKLAYKLWYSICNPDTENKIRLMLIDLFYQLYGKNSPFIKL